MPTINRLPIGGGGASSSGAAGLNIFTQPNEPEKKDGIWIQTGNQYEKIITDARILNQNNDVWARVATITMDIRYIYEYAGVVYALDYNYQICIININNGTIINTGIKLSPVWNWKYICNIGSYVYYLEYTYNSSGILEVYRYSIINKTTTKIYSISYSASITDVICRPFMYNGHLCIGFVNKQGYSYPFYIYDFESKSSIITGPNINNNLDPVVICNGCIYYIEINTYDQSDENHYGLYRYNGAWTRISISDIYRRAGGNNPYLLLYNNELHILCYFPSYKYHYKYDNVNNSFIKLADPIASSGISSYDLFYLAIDNNIYIFNRYVNNVYEVIKYSLSYNVFDNNTLILQRGEDNGKYKTAFADLTKSVSGVNRFISGFDDCYYYGSGSFEAAPMYYGNGSQWIRFKN